MAVTATHDGLAPPRAASTHRPLWLLVGAALALILARALGLLPEALIRPPEWMIPPAAPWLDAAFAFVSEDLGLIHVTRAASGLLELLLDTTANLLHGKRRWPHLGPIPWSAVAAGAAVLGWWLGGWRLAALAGGTLAWTALVGQWEIAMETMSVLVVAAPLAVAIGLSLGAMAWRWPRFDAGLRPVLSVLQTLPFFTYLLPAVIFFKVGPTAGAVATVVYAVPPMVLMTALGLAKVSPEVVEAGHMSGCTRWQMLSRVYLPAARTEILVGVNQVVMLSLAMVVLTAFIGMPGLGATLLQMMGSLKLGRSFEIGVTIVLLAITLDRLSKAWVVRQPAHVERGTPWWRRHAVLLAGLAAFTLFLALAQALPILAEIGRRQSLSQSGAIDDAIRAALDLDAVEAVTEWLRWFLNVKVLIPFRNALLWIPMPAFVLLVAAGAFALGGRRPAVLAGAFFTLVALSGWWDRSVITLYTVISAVALAALIGIPAGVLASRSEAWSRRVLLACDTAQTFPSFIYLIPAIMLFGVNDVAVVFSILIFAAVPLARYTVEGLRAVPVETMEAADMSGATRRQRLLAVQLPLALPTMAVGFNQAIMFAFFMVIVAAFIGTQDLGQELQRTLAGADLGKNIVLGLNVALMALTFDMAIRAWAVRRQGALGLR